MIGGAYACDMYVCFCSFPWMCIWILVSYVQKLFQVSQWILAHPFNLRVLASSNQVEIVGTSKLEADI